MAYYRNFSSIFLVSPHNLAAIQPKMGLLGFPPSSRHFRTIFPPPSLKKNKGKICHNFCLISGFIGVQIVQVFVCFKQSIVNSVIFILIRCFLENIFHQQQEFSLLYMSNLSLLFVKYYDGFFQKILCDFMATIRKILLQ